MNRASKKFYVYLHYRGDLNLPFYVGKGTGNRILTSLQVGPGCPECLKCQTIRNLREEGISLYSEIAFESDDEQVTFDKETELIAYGRTQNWPLVNVRDGIIGKHAGRSTQIDLETVVVQWTFKKGSVDIMKDFVSNETDAHSVREWAERELMDVIRRQRGAK